MAIKEMFLDFAHQSCYLLYHMSQIGSLNGFDQPYNGGGYQNR